jgi:hypothetical protein
MLGWLGILLRSRRHDQTSIPVVIGSSRVSVHKCYKRFGNLPLLTVTSYWLRIHMKREPFPGNLIRPKDLVKTNKLRNP